MQMILNSVLFILRSLITGPIYARIETLVLTFMHAEMREGESQREFNDRRKNMVVDAVKEAWPMVRTALIEAVIALLVAKYKPK